MTKCVFFIPIALALLFIKSTKSLVFFDTFLAKINAAALLELDTVICNRSAIVHTCPGYSFVLLNSGSVDIIYSLFVIVTVSSSESCPLFTASNVKYIVINLVIDAGFHLVSILY
ncbi:Uncharacterised protein [Staphylococcus aureus]|nr:Uncharacterised protein [Staphylococcus aureus]